MAGRLVRGWARTPVELRVAAVVAGFVASSVLPQPCGALVCRHEAGWATTVLVIVKSSRMVIDSAENSAEPNSHPCGAVGKVYP